MEELNVELVHLYGLTESFGPFTLNLPQPSSGTDLKVLRGGVAFLVAVRLRRLRCARLGRTVG